MRSPTQLKLESATGYTVTHSFKAADEVEYTIGDTVPGDTARSWPTFRSILGAGWLLPTTGDAPSFLVEHEFKNGRTYVRGDIIDGALVRSWPTFLNLLNIGWIVTAPTTPSAAGASPVAVTARTKTARARVRISKTNAETT